MLHQSMEFTRKKKWISPEKNEELTINTTDFHNGKEHGKPRRTLGWINMASWPLKKIKVQLLKYLKTSC